MLDQRTARNLALIAKLEAQILDDGLQMPKKKAPDKRTIKHPVLQTETCICSVEIRNGEKWKIVNLRCFDHGLFGNRVEPEKAMNFNLSRHPYAE